MMQMTSQISHLMTQMNNNNNDSSKRMMIPTPRMNVTSPINVMRTIPNYLAPYLTKMIKMIKMTTAT